MKTVKRRAVGSAQTCERAARKVRPWRQRQRIAEVRRTVIALHRQQQYVVARIVAEADRGVFAPARYRVLLRAIAAIGAHGGATLGIVGPE